MQEHKPPAYSASVLNYVSAVQLTIFYAPVHTYVSDKTVQSIPCTNVALYIEIMQ